VPPPDSDDGYERFSWAIDQGPDSDHFWDAYTDPLVLPYLLQTYLDGIPPLQAAADSCRNVRQNVYEPARRGLDELSDYNRPVDQRIGTLANLRRLSDASRAATQTVLGVTLGPSWQGQENEWFQPLWNMLYGPLPEGTHPGHMLPMESAAAGIGHFRDVALSQAWQAAVEDARAQWRAAPGPFTGIGLHGAVENVANPRNWVVGRMTSAIPRPSIPWNQIPWPWGR
jgi:hypothetical protein